MSQRARPSVTARRAGWSCCGHPASSTPSTVVQPNLGVDLAGDGGGKSRDGVVGSLRAASCSGAGDAGADKQAVDSSASSPKPVSSSHESAARSGAEPERSVEGSASSSRGDATDPAGWSTAARRQRCHDQRLCRTATTGEDSGGLRRAFRLLVVRADLHDDAEKGHWVMYVLGSSPPVLDHRLSDVAESDVAQPAWTPAR